MFKLNISIINNNEYNIGNISTNSIVTIGSSK